MLLLMQILKWLATKGCLQILYAGLSSLLHRITPDVHFLNVFLAGQMTKWHESWKTICIRRIPNLHLVMQIMSEEIQNWLPWIHDGSRSDSIHLKATVWTYTSPLTRFHGVNFSFAARLCDANGIVVMAFSKSIFYPKMVQQCILKCAVFGLFSVL